MTHLADGTGAWSLLERVLLSDENFADRGNATLVVRTPLDLILLLDHREIGEVILGGSFARTAYVRAFLHESYPRLVVSNLPSCPVTNATLEATLAET
jgi:hypothetical protein